ncbi:MAG: HAMP domain-containing histidine kinase [Desulfovibrio sp.]|nr:HAMP domain-containing histidine kinase [Desulfovibrio sp.]
MTERRCVARLFASAVHELRNILAVIRESTGLGIDLLDMEQKSAENSHQARLHTVLEDSQKAVRQGAALSDAMDYLAYASDIETNGPCDITRVCHDFCLLYAREARSSKITLLTDDGEDPVWAQFSPVLLFRALLDVVDLCTSVGGQVSLKFSGERRNKHEGVKIEVVAGTNRELVVSALASCPRFEGPRIGWMAKLMPWTSQDPCFFLTISEAEAQTENH